MTELRGMGLGDVASEIERNLQLDSSRMANQWMQKIEPSYNKRLTNEIVASRVIFLGSLKENEPNAQNR